MLKTSNFIIFFLLFITAYGQEETISIDSINLENKILLFEKYELIEKNCIKNGVAKYCEKAFKIFDNNIKSLAEYKKDAVQYLNIQNETISKIDLEKEIYTDKNVYRYFIEYKPIISKGGNSCFSNPGALLIEYILYDRIKDKRYAIKLDYTMFVCDIFILVNAIKKSIKKE